MGKKGIRDDAPKEGFDGSVIYIRERPIPGTSRKQSTSIRSKPGTFEWRYCRGKPGSEMDMLYLAGSDFCELWERAGMDGPGSVDWAKSGTTQWRGLPDARVVALDEVKAMSRALGMLVTQRLVNYCVEGKTSRQIATAFGDPERDMAIVLASDLKAAAIYLGYMPKGG